MTRLAISVDDLGKKYRLGVATQSYRTLRDSLTGMATAPARNLARRLRPGPGGSGPGHRPEFWALKDVTFDVKHGDVLGIIGRNGAGKSTLLKLLSQITEPTQGRIRISGRVASLLEVGTGFHPELTGRENVYLNGAILGMPRVDIARKFDEIVAFAEVEQFVDTPVKHYSSGMYLRLAFAVAAHLEPEILIVDEVLAVGDAAFQKKCLGKMDEVSHQGRTVLFVSHNMLAIEGLCKQAILLESGRLKHEGKASDIVSMYLSQARQSRSYRLTGDPPPARAYVTAVDVASLAPSAPKEFPVTFGVCITTAFRVISAIRSCQLSIHLWRVGGSEVLVTTNMDVPGNKDLSYDPGAYTARCLIPAEYLRNGSYYLNLAIVIPEQEIISRVDEAVYFDVVDDDSIEVKLNQNRGGAVYTPIPWQVQTTEQ